MSEYLKNIVNEVYRLADAKLFALAFVRLRFLLKELHEWWAIQRCEELETLCGQMLKYSLGDYEDLDRGKIIAQLQVDICELADDIVDAIELRKLHFEKTNTQSINLKSELLGEGLVFDDERSKALVDLFRSVWLNGRLKAEDRRELIAFVENKNIDLPFVNRDANEKGSSETISFANGETMSFTYCIDEWAGGEHRLIVEGWNGTSWNELLNENIRTQTSGKNFSVGVQSYSQIRFTRKAYKGATNVDAGKKTIKVTGIKITRIISMSASPNPLSCSLTAIGETSDAKQISVDYSNIGVTQIVSSTNTTDFTLTPKQNGFDNCYGIATYDVVFHPKGTIGGDRSTTITIAGRESGSNSNKKSVTITVNGRAKGFPEQNWNGSTEFYVDETIDLASLWWTSNSEKAPSYAIEEFVAEDETGVDPVLNGTSIKLTGSGKLTVKIIQDASETYSALSTTQEITIKKYPSNFKWLLGDPLDCYVDDWCEESVLFSRLSDAPMTITSSNTNAVVYQDGKFTAVGAGEAAITVEQGKHYKWEEFTSTYTIRVNKYDMSASLVRGDAVLNELISNAINVSHGLQDYRVESKNPGIAEYLDGNKIQTYHTENIAQFRVTRDEDRKYKGLDVTLDLNVKKSGEVCYLVENKTASAKYELGNTGESFSEEVFTLNGKGDVLNFEYRIDNNNDADYWHYLTAQYSTSDNGDDFSDITGSTISSRESDWSSKVTITIPDNAKRLRFKRTSEWWGTKNFQIRNIYVTRKKELDHQVAGNVLVLDPVNIGQTSQKSFNLKWSTCADEIVLVSDNDLFELNTTSINASNGGGNTNIQVTFKGSTTPGVYQAFISIYDRTQVEHLTVTCEVKDKLNTTIHYTGAYQYSEGHDCLTGLFYVQDEVPNVVEGAVVKLSSSNEDILEICEDRTSFIPHCGGEVTLTATYEGDEYRAGATWEGTIIVANCTQKIEWNQNFKNYIADVNGLINEPRTLTAEAIPTNFNITYELDAAAEEFADLVEIDGVWSLVVTGVGTGHIIAHAPEGEYNKQMYDATSVMHEIRVRKEGEKCNTDSTYISKEIALSKVLSWFYDDEITIPLENRPYERMEFYTHVNSNSYNNDLTVSFSTDGGQTWVYPITYTDIPDSYDWNQPYLYENIPSGATHVKFRTTSTACTYINMMKMVQKSYLTSVDEIRVKETGINMPFEETFTVNYSDVNIIQYSVSNEYGMDLTITPMSEINNDCGDWGTYDFRLTGTCTRPIAKDENIVEYITLSTSDGAKVTIPVYILSNTFYFDIQDGNWTETTNWTFQGTTTHGKLPDIYHPVVISKVATIVAAEGTYEGYAYGATIDENGRVAIKSNGGLTVGVGGVVGAADGAFTIDNTPTGAGFLKVDPSAANKPSANVTINYTTAAYNSGNPRDEIWQYMGAPGEGMDIVEHEDKTLIYHWNEEKGWEKQVDEKLMPFAGYVFTQNKDKTKASFEITATPIIADKTINLTCTPEGMRGGNVFANSYLAPIDVANIDPQNDLVGVDPIFYLFNSGSWNQWQSEGGKDHMNYGVSPGQYYAITPGSASMIDANIDQTTIPPMQGVYVVANKNGAQIKLDYAKHVYGTEASNRPMRAPEMRDENFKRVRLQVNSQNSGADRMYVIQHEDATKGYDYGYDAKNIAAEDQVNIYTSEQGGEMEISVSDKIDSTYIGINAGSDSEYRLRITSVVGEKLLLKDLETETVVAVEDEVEYTFSATPKSVNNKRFLLIDQMHAAEIEDLVKVYIYDNVVHVLEAPKDSDMAVYAVGGMMMAHYAMGEAPCSIELSGLPTGVYVVRIADKAVKFVCK